MDSTGCIRCGRPRNSFAKKFCSIRCRGLYQKEQGTRHVAERFWERVDKRGPDECWLWTGKLRTKGYGTMSVNDAPASAHRVSWEVHFGPVPDGLSVLHNCPDGDNRRCVNPDHLWLGTPADNSHDMVRKGRSTAGDRNPSRTHKERMPRGEAHWTRKCVEMGMEHITAPKLTPDAVREIRRRSQEGEGPSKLAVEFGVTRGVIYKVVRRKTYRRVSDF